MKDTTTYKAGHEVDEDLDEETNLEHTNDTHHDEDDEEEEDKVEGESDEETSGEVFDALKRDHRHVEELFSRFEKADKRSRSAIAEEALMALEIHSALEEELVYPAIAEVIDHGELVDEAREEHHVVKLLIKELHKMDAGDKGFATKFKVLGELVGHHVEEEENEMFPQAVEADIDAEALSEEVAARKEKLMQKYDGSGKKSVKNKRKSAA